MIKIIHGKNTIVSKKNLKELKDSFKGVNIKEFDLNDFNNFSLLANELRMVGLFGGEDLIVVKDFFSFKEGEFKKKDLIDLIKNYTRDICFVEYGEITKTNLKLFKKIDFVEIKNDLFDFKKEKNKIQKFILEYVSEKGFKIENIVLDSLINGYRDIFAILNEIDKLGLYDKNISKENFNKLSIIPFESDLFKLIESIALRNKKLSYYLLEQEKRKGTDFNLVFGMVVYQFRNLIICKEAIGNGGRNPGLNFFVFNKLKNVVRSISLKDLILLYFELYKYDNMIKKGKIDSLYALECFVSEMK